MTEPILRVDGLSKRFRTGGGLSGRAAIKVRAVEDVSFHVGQGESFGLIGESGCGKSTTGRCVLRLVEPDAGEIRFRDDDVIRADKPHLRALRRKMQIVFQDPYSSLNPRLTIGQALAEPMRVHRLASRAELAERVSVLLDEVGLPADAARRFPHEFSGGQRQRIGIARALSVSPELIVADEPVSALDVSIQAQILLLLRRLQERHSLSFLFISHDLGVVRHFCQRLAVMYLGRIVETGPVPEIFHAPLHPYTRLLLAASPIPDPKARRALVREEGEVPSNTAPPSGCHFHPRCPYATDLCRRVAPRWQEVAPNQGVACHLFDKPL